jgi:acyl transferase domain-containing protein
VRELWANLSNGANCVAAVPAERWPHADYFEADPERAVQRGLSYGKWGGFLDDLYCFDPRFFSISPRDAAGMNPKERVFLQCAWHVLEDAGWPPGSLAGERVGVFVGATKAGQDLYDSSLNAIANRVSYCFDFRGPSMAIDTTCSSSLVAVYEACLHVRAGECSIAIAGGVHAILHPTHFAALAKGRFLSPDGKCKPFSADANGMAPGEGVGAVLIKPLSKAQRDHDHIYAAGRRTATPYRIPWHSVV